MPLRRLSALSRGLAIKLVHADTLPQGHALRQETARQVRLLRSSRSQAERGEVQRAFAAKQQLSRRRLRGGGGRTYNRDNVGRFA